MNLESYDDRDGFRVWLSREERDRLIETAHTHEQRLFIQLGSLCGLRSHEILDVRPSHVVESDKGPVLRVWHGKGDKYRETPVPLPLANVIWSVDEVKGGDDDTVISVGSTRTLQRWIRTLCEQLEPDDDAWRYVTTHDLRRTWASQLRTAGVDPITALSWGGWNDLDTFLEHYKGEDTPEFQLREREKVDWL